MALSAFAVSPPLGVKVTQRHLQRHRFLFTLGTISAPPVVAAAKNKQKNGSSRARLGVGGGGVCSGSRHLSPSLSHTSATTRCPTAPRLNATAAGARVKIDDDDETCCDTLSRVEVNVMTRLTSCDDEDSARRARVAKLPLPPPTPLSLPSLIRKVAGIAAFAAVLCAVTAVLFPDVALAASKTAAATSSPLMSFANQAVDFIHHLDANLIALFSQHGNVAYGVLFAIIFCETGLVITPFLPGDSLLFATGALGAQGVLNFPFVLALLFVAAVLGDTVNYGVGSTIGGRIIEANPKIFKKDYIEKTKIFYEKFGGKTVVMARFFVIVRTFAPFVAGVAKMKYGKFLMYNVIGGAIWVSSFMFLGYFFGQIPAVQENFVLTVTGIVLLSLVPVVLEVVQHRREQREG